MSPSNGSRHTRSVEQAAEAQVARKRRSKAGLPESDRSSRTAQGQEWMELATATDTL